jgi:hypothetical protein
MISVHAGLLLADFYFDFYIQNSGKHSLTQRSASLKVIPTRRIGSVNY